MCFFSFFFFSWHSYAEIESDVMWWQSLEKHTADVTFAILPLQGITAILVHVNISYSVTQVFFIYSEYIHQETMKK